MFISSVNFYDSCNFDQKKPIFVEVKEKFKIVDPKASNRIAQRVYGMAKWLIPAILSYGCAHAFRFTLVKKLSIATLALICSLFPRFVSLFILPASLAPFLLPSFIQSVPLNRKGDSLALYDPERATIRSQGLNIRLKVDDIEIDAFLVGKNPKKSRRWVLYSCGNFEPYEQNGTMRHILQELNANGLFFNYPGVGDSSGPVNKQTLVKAYQVLLRFLEDPSGIGAKEIIGYGYSLGGAVQAEALRTHPLKEGIRYVFVNDRTFSSLSAIASKILFKWAGLLVKVFGWELDCVASSKTLEAPELIIQSAEEGGAIKHDGIIPKEVSLMHQLEVQGIEKNIFLYKTSSGHNSPLNAIVVAGAIQSILSRSEPCR